MEKKRRKEVGKIEKGRKISEAGNDLNSVLCVFVVVIYLKTFFHVMKRGWLKTFLTLIHFVLFLVFLCFGNFISFFILFITYSSLPKHFI
jgi:hypothetical protein